MLFFFCPQLNRAEFEDVDDETRVQYEGFRPGMYIRLEISSIPCEFVTNFDPHYPIILGGLGSSEGNVGYLQVCAMVSLCSGNLRMSCDITVYFIEMDHVFSSWQKSNNYLKQTKKPYLGKKGF